MAADRGTPDRAIAQPDWRDYESTLMFVACCSLREDRADDDPTSLSLDPRSDAIRGECSVVARQDLVLAGWAAFDAVFGILDASVLVERRREDSDSVASGEVIGVVSGRPSALLRGERTALNLLCRLSGVATLTRRFVREVEGTGVEILDTRKTTPCLRALERHAVRCGGGVNHRHDLAAMAMIKDNHLALVGCEGLASLVDRIRTRHGIPIEIEVSAPEQLDQVIPLRPERILLDNMSVESLRHCVRAIRASGGSIYVEASGGIDLSNVRPVALTGVDGISVGRITHSAASADIAMDWGTGKT